jgi:hypothetical protein
VQAPHLTLVRITPPPGDDRLTFSGRVLFPVPYDPPLDPIHKGVRVLVTDATRATVVDASTATGFYDAATGRGWTANARGWKYRDRNGVGIVRVGLKVSAAAPGLIRFGVKGRSGSWPVSPSHLPVRGMIVIDAPEATTGQCGNADFPGPTPSCSFNGSGSALRCR